MWPRWLLSLAILCGMLVAPFAMTSASATLRPQADAVQMVHGHCDEGSTADQRAPAKSTACAGICAAIEVDAMLIAVPVASPRANAPIPTMSSLDGILPERSTPPPRLS